MKSTFNLILFLALFLFVAAFNQANAQSEIVLIEEESQIWIEGSSTVADIYCKALEIIGYATIENVNTNNPSELTNGNNGEVRLKIPVYDFDCGRRQMNRDFYRALRAEIYPSIEFSYVSAKLVTNLDPECAPFQLDVKGVLTVAGVKKDVSVLVDIEPCELNRFILKGSKKIKMTDFGIEPPSAMFGLIRAHDELEVFFSLTAEQRSSIQALEN